MGELSALMRAGADPRILRSQLVELATHEWPEVREAVAGNPSTPREALVDLASDEDWPVQAAVAENPSTPPATLVAMAEAGWSEAVETLLTILREPVTPASIIDEVVAALPPASPSHLHDQPDEAELDWFAREQRDDPFAVPWWEPFPNQVWRLVTLRSSELSLQRKPHSRDPH